MRGAPAPPQNNFRFVYLVLNRIELKCEARADSYSSEVAALALGARAQTQQIAKVMRNWPMKLQIDIGSATEFAHSGGSGRSDSDWCVRDAEEGGPVGLTTECMQSNSDGAFRVTRSGGLWLQRGGGGGHARICGAQ